MKLSAQQMTALKEVYNGKFRPKSSARTVSSLASKGLIKFAVGFGWVMSSAGVDVIKQIQEG
ncbi:hypothetical protein [Morganella morganii]|uniref:hypothetical protein n=1 Tax=Morganella morganii TaxID=582 RepID=UPI001BD93F30|nr:hypothetical protein [Morganella morganii]MBT0521283.1 hypothetical protein [Morganella morganii subsp. morganii]QWL88191.1 hypothetical protein IZ187_11360 [Morganella morganii subsp. morganii]QWL90467.1 hypothetical protein IZ187_04525 [Morganella morganii subsp. morganii]